MGELLQAWNDGMLIGIRILGAGLVVVVGGAILTGLLGVVLTTVGNLLHGQDQRWP